MNLLGAFLGTGVAETVGSGIVELPEADASLVVVLAALRVSSFRWWSPQSWGSWSRTCL